MEVLPQLDLIKSCVSIGIFLILGIVGFGYIPIEMPNWMFDSAGTWESVGGLAMEDFRRLSDC